MATRQQGDGEALAALERRMAALEARVARMETRAKPAARPAPEVRRLGGSEVSVMVTPQRLVMGKRRTI